MTGVNSFCLHQTMSNETDEEVRDTLDQVFRSDGQTYEQFMNGFLFLTREDVTEPSNDEINNHENIGSSEFLNGNLNGNGFIGENCSPQDDNENISGKVRCSSHSSDHSLSEEELGPGSQAPSILMRTSETTGGTVVQLDNFVDDEGSPLSDLSPEDSGDEADYTFSGHTPLSKTGAQVTNNATVQKVSSEAETAFEENDEECQSQDTDTELYNQSKLSTTEGKRVGSQSDFSDSRPGDSLAASELGTNHSVPCSSQTVTSTPENGSNYFKPLPGEVDSDEFEDGTRSLKPTNIRHLSIKTTFRECPEDDGSSTHQEMENECCAVEPFTLDEDFDYDNVVLTPKFDFMTLHVQTK